MNENVLLKIGLPFLFAHIEQLFRNLRSFLEKLRHLYLRVEEVLWFILFYGLKRSMIEVSESVEATSKMFRTLKPSLVGELLLHVFGVISGCFLVSCV